MALAKNPHYHLLRRQFSHATEHQPVAGPVARDGSTARKWRDVVSARGGDVAVIHLPKVGVRGNAFPMADFHDVAVAD